MFGLSVNVVVILAVYGFGCREYYLLTEVIETKKKSSHNDSWLWSRSLLAFSHVTIT